MSPGPLVYIVVLNWNGWRDTLQCLGSLEQQTYGNFQTVVVDNGSSDGSVEHLRAGYPNLDILQTGSNLGFGGGNNVGIAFALRRGADYVMILNNDTDVASDCLTAMIEVMHRHSEIGILGPQVFNPTTGADEPHRQFPSGVPRPGRARSPSVGQGVELTDYVDGSCMLIRAGVLEEMGTFDLRYFHFWEDIDLCWRAWKAGWSVARTRQCAIQHRSGSSTAAAAALKMYYNLRGLLLFQAKASGTTVARAMVRPGSLRVWLPCVLGLRGFLHPEVKRAIGRAIIHALRGRTGRCGRYSPA